MTTDEAWRAECEARAVMRWSKDRRDAYYRSVERHRGKNVARKLIADVKSEWAKQTSI